MGLIPIHYERMFQLHPWPGEDFMNLINGSIKSFHQQGPAFENTCASEISYAFNCITEHIINTWGDYGKGGVWAKKVRTEMDVDGYEYIYSTIDLHQYPQQPLWQWRNVSQHVENRRSKRRHHLSAC